MQRSSQTQRRSLIACRLARIVIEAASFIVVTVRKEKRMTSCMRLASLFVLAVSSSARAHVHPRGCAHNHIRLGTNCTMGETCNTTGTCLTVGGISWSLCKCDMPSSGGCFCAGDSEFDPGPSGVPDPGETIIYTAISSPNNFMEVALDSGISLALFGPGGSALSGTVSLTFGSFADPANVPVTLNNLSLTLPAWMMGGQSTGTNSFSLAPATPGNLVYNSFTGIIDIASNIQVLINNKLQSNVLVVVSVQGEVDNSGMIKVFIDAELNPPPCPGDINSDQVINVADLLAVINSWGSCPTPCPPNCSADINLDCTVNVSDLLAVINAWGPCP